MYKSIKISYLIVINLLLINSNICVKAFSGLSDTSVLIPANLKESFIVLTDRTVYGTGENCLFSAFRTGENLDKLAEWSRVLYLELLKADGKPVIQTKFYITGNYVDGSFTIPENLLTGYYYLRVYTRWMRNFNPLNFPMVRLKIFNPVETAVENSVRAGSNGKHLVVTENNTIVQENIISLMLDNIKVQTREKVHVSFNTDKKVGGLPGNFCVTVIRPTAMDSVNYGLIASQAERETGSYRLKFLPDLRGLSLSGSIVDKASGKGMGNMQVMLSVLGSFSDFYSYVTQPDGSFVFDLRSFSGKSEMYITLPPGNNKSFEILVDEEYAGNNIPVLQQVFKLSAADKKTAKEILFNSQVTKAFKDETKADTVYQADADKYFYGKPTNSIYIDEYVDLPTIEEVLFELVHEVSVVKKKDGFYFKSNGYYSDVEIFKPLILIDNIPVDDFAALLKTSPGKLERIDVIDRIYAKGDYLYGGILNLISRKGDFGGVSLPDNSYFFSYDGFYQKYTTDFPDYGDSISDTRIPDLRNCLYWNPALKLNSSNEADFGFYTSDLKGTFLILVRGVASDGTIVEGNCTITVE